MGQTITGSNDQSSLPRGGVAARVYTEQNRNSSTVL